MTQAALRVERVGHVYDDQHGRVDALDNISFDIRPGEFGCIVGPSGSGKSTFLSLLCGIVVPQAGSIAILGNDITRLSPSERDAFRAEHFGVIFQMFNLLPYGSVLDNVLLPLSFAPQRRRHAGPRLAQRNQPRQDRLRRRQCARRGQHADL